MTMAAVEVITVDAVAVGVFAMEGTMEKIVDILEAHRDTCYGKGQVNTAQCGCGQAVGLVVIMNVLTGHCRIWLLLLLSLFVVSYWLL